MTDDAQLLRHYIEDRSQLAFGELVQRHLAMVYHAAARQLGPDAHLAADVAQAVFLLLAAKSRALARHTSLAGWLHATTRFKVAEVLRAERRRRAREAAAHLMHVLTNDEAAVHEWDQLRPVIDEVLLELNAADREAVLLRYFENRPFAEIAARLRLPEPTANKRVERALDKLRERLGQRGIKSTAAALGILLGGQSALAAPATLAASVTGAVMSAALPATATFSVISIMSTKTTVAAVMAVLVAGGVATQQMNTKREAALELAALQRENVALATRVRTQEARRAQAAREARTVSSSTPAPATRPPPSVGPGATGGLASVEEGRAFLRDNPEVREALRHYTRTTLEDQYAELIAAMGLTVEEKERFIDILANAQRRIVGEHQLTLAETDWGPGELTRQLRDLLGDARYQQYRDHNSQAVFRSVTQELTRSLYYTPAPLTAAQAGGLKLIVERAIADPTLGPRYTGNVWPYIPEAAWNRIVSDAQAVLPEPQVVALRELQQQSRFWHAQRAASAAYRAAQISSKQPPN